MAEISSMDAQGLVLIKDIIKKRPAIWQRHSLSHVIQLSSRIFFFFSYRFFIAFLAGKVFLISLARECISL